MFLVVCCYKTITTKHERRNKWFIINISVYGLALLVAPGEVGIEWHLKMVDEAIAG